MKQVRIDVVRVHGAEVPLPRYQSKDAVGLDLHAALPEDAVIPPLGRLLVPTGIAMAIPPGYEGQVRPRSGLALRHGVTVLNSPGTIDPDYRGEVKVLLVNLGAEPFVVRPNDRVAQLVIAEVSRAELSVTLHLEETERGEGGYGSTGAS